MRKVYNLTKRAKSSSADAYKIQDRQQHADQCFTAGSAYKTVDNDYVDAFATKNDK